MHVVLSNSLLQFPDKTKKIGLEVLKASKPIPDHDKLVSRRLKKISQEGGLF